MSLLRSNSRFLSHLTKSRSCSTNNVDINQVFTNRNPRNLEKMRIGYKPDGYHVEKNGRSFWHKLKLEVTGRHITATVSHFQNGDVLKASTEEWAVKKQLYRNTDTSAFINLGRVLAQRCLESGLLEIACDIEMYNQEGKVAQFFKALQAGGICLEESPQYKPARPWDQLRPEKPWEVTE